MSTVEIIVRVEQPNHHPGSAPSITPYKQRIVLLPGERIEKLTVLVDDEIIIATDSVAMELVREWGHDHTHTRKDNPEQPVEAAP